jgi:hypothetical protein
MPVRGLDEACGVCGRPSGDHTLREWSVCLGEVTTHQPYEETPADAVEVVNAAMRERFQLEPGTIVADNVIIRAATLDAATGPLQVKLPAVLHEFQVALSGQPPATVAKIIYVGDVNAVRQYGRLARDSANAAANAAERAA